MPVYEYYCRSCETTFDKLQRVSASNETAACPSGHHGAARTITVFATPGAGGREAEAASGGGCCGGGGCACGAGRN